MGKRRLKGSKPTRVACDEPDDTLRDASLSEVHRLRYSDDSLRYRGALRAEHLQRRMTSTGFNPLTGEPISRVHVPDAPNPPSH